MSGGAFDYIQYRFEGIVTRIEAEINRATMERPPLVHEKCVSIWKRHSDTCKSGIHHGFKSFESAKKAYTDKRWYRILEEKENEVVVEDKVTKEVYEIRGFIYTDYADGGYYPDYTPETLQEFRNAIYQLRKAAIYAQRVDWLISGDDGEDTFHERLKEDLEKLPKIEDMI